MSSAKESSPSTAVLLGNSVSQAIFHRSDIPRIQTILVLSARYLIDSTRRAHLMFIGSR